MGQPCRVCADHALRRVNAALLAGEPVRRIATQFTLSEAGVRRHATYHLGGTLRLMRQERQMWDMQEIARRLQALDADAQHVIAHAKQSGDDRLVLAGIDTAGRNLKRVVRLAAGHDLEERVRQLEEQRDAPL